MFLSETSFDKNVKVWSGSGFCLPISSVNGWGQVLLNELHKSPPDQVIQINHNTSREITCSEMRLKAIRFSEILSNIGVRCQDNITIICSHHDDLVSVVIGCLAIGAIVNPLDISFTINEITHSVKMTQPKLIICDREIMGKVQETLRTIGQRPKVIVFGETITDIEAIDKDLLTGFESTTFVPNGITDAEQIAFVLCSSGTTGTPKGVLISHSMAMNGLKMWWNVVPGEIYFSTSGLLWLTCIGMVAHSIIYRCPRIIVDSTTQITPNLILNVLTHHKVSVIFISPTVAMGLLKLLEDCESSITLSSIRILASGGSHVSDKLIQRMNHFLPNGKMLSCYGMTEVCGLIASNERSYKKDSVGQLAPNIESVIIDDTSRRLGPGEIGEIGVRPRNYRIMGYLNNENENRNVFDLDNWFRTGDIGYFDEQNFLYLVDRKKDMLKYCNFQISPHELEVEIQNHFPVSGVCVIGIDDEECGQLPAAVIVPKENAIIFTENAVMQLIADKFSDSKHLRGGVFFVDNFPITNSGKIQRNLVKEMISMLRRN